MLITYFLFNNMWVFNHNENVKKKKKRAVQNGELRQVYEFLSDYALGASPKSRQERLNPHNYVQRNWLISGLLEKVDHLTRSDGYMLCDQLST